MSAGRKKLRAENCVQKCTVTHVPFATLLLPIFRFFRNAATYDKHEEKITMLLMLPMIPFFFNFYILELHYIHR